MGRNKDPESAKKQRGTARKDRESATNAIHYTLLTKVPSKPKILPTGDPAKMFRKICSELINAEKLTTLSLPQVINYCLQYHLYLEAWSEVELNGAVLKYKNGTQGVNPNYKVMQDARSEMVKFERYWGLTPYSQQQIIPADKNKKKEGEDELDLD